MTSAAADVTTAADETNETYATTCSDAANVDATNVTSSAAGCVSYNS